jgi:hypothetical protein
MSSPEEQDFSGLAAAAEAALKDAERALAEGKTNEVSDETVQQLLTAGARLFARKIEMEERYFLPFTSREAATATDVVTTVCEMLRAADLNTFDLSMWFSRPHPGDAP